MQNTSSPASDAEMVSSIDPLLTQVEQELHALGEALLRRDSAAIDLHSGQLHHALGSTVQAISRYTKDGREIPLALKSRLSKASAQVLSQRECLARATSALDRAMNVLMPQFTPVVYSASGTVRAYGSTGRTQA